MTDAFQNRLFGCLVDLCDVIVAGLGADFELVEPGQGTDGDIAGAARGLYGGVEEGLHGGAIVQSATGAASHRHTRQTMRDS